MSDAVRLLTAMAQAIAAMSLYAEGHPAREKAVDTAYGALARFQENQVRASFTFLGNDIVLDRMPIRELRAWDWGPRLARAGIQRLEFTGIVEREDFVFFLDDAFRRLTGPETPSAEIRQTRRTNIRYGAVGLKGDTESLGTRGSRLETATLDYTLREEADTVDWLHTELKERSRLHMLEADAIVRSLSVAMHGDQAFLIPLLDLKRFDQYTTTHALNVSVLAMALAESIGLGPSEVRSFGISGLLHDLGKTRIPEEILNKPGKLTEREREVMNRHTVEGARIILETEDHLDLAAVVAYEHHIKLDGGGYPSLSRPRRCHQASDLVHICDVYDALRTRRPYRDAWPHERVVRYVAEGSGSEFDPELAHAFVQMMEKWETRIAILEEEDQPLPLGEPVDPDEAAASDDVPSVDPEDSGAGSLADVRTSRPATTPDRDRETEESPDDEDLRRITDPEEIEAMVARLVRERQAREKTGPDEGKSAEEGSGEEGAPSSEEDSPPAGQRRD